MWSVAGSKGQIKNYNGALDGNLRLARLVELGLGLLDGRLGVLLGWVLLLGRVLGRGVDGLLDVDGLLLLLRLHFVLGHLLLDADGRGGDVGGALVTLEAHEVDEEDNGGSEDQDPARGAVRRHDTKD
jgi:hypothetical protein